MRRLVSLPSIEAQLTAAFLIAKGVIDAADFHPATIATVNVALATANMTAINTQAATGLATGKATSAP